MKKFEFTYARLAAEILCLLEEGEKSLFTIEHKTKNLIEEIMINHTLTELMLEGLVGKTERLPGGTVYYYLTEKGKKLVKEGMTKAKKDRRFLEFFKES